MEKKPIVSVTYENERISIKNSLPYLKCVLRLSYVVHGPIYGRFMGFYVNGKPLSVTVTVTGAARYYYCHFYCYYYSYCYSRFITTVTVI